MSTEKPYVVIKRGLFWRPEDKGYTSDLNGAGRYTKEEAEDRCHGGEEPVTMALASSYYVPEIHAEADQLRAEVERLELNLLRIKGVAANEDLEEEEAIQLIWEYARTALMPRTARQIAARTAPAKETKG